MVNFLRVCKHTCATSNANINMKHSYRIRWSLIYNFLYRITTQYAVSYTHLDVYKRQACTSAVALNWPLGCI